MHKNCMKMMIALAAMALLQLSVAWARESADEPAMEASNWAHVRMLDNQTKWNLWRTQHPEIVPDLRRADLSGESGRSDLTFVNLRDTDLREADLRGAYLGGADLTGAKLDGAKLKGAYYTDSTIFPEGFDPRAAGMKAD